MSSHKNDTSVFKHTFGTDITCEGLQSDIVVLKIGSSSITSPDGLVQLSNIGRFVEFVHHLRFVEKRRVIIVSSGAVSVGAGFLKMSRPKELVVKQACAAIGQSRLMSLYDSLFGVYNIKVAQVLLTRDNINNEYHYLNATNTLEQLLAMDIVPIVNENDSVSVSEIKIGDNDSLSAMVACLVKADHLFLLTDVSSLYTADPREDPTAKPIHEVTDIEPILAQFAAVPTKTSGKWGTGGFATKVQAALLSTSCGITTSVISSTELPNITSILNKDYTVGTTFFPSQTPLVGRKKFLYVGMVPSGEIYVDKQAAMLFTQHQSRSYDLLPAGVMYCTQNVVPGSCVTIVVADDAYLRQLFGKSYISRDSNGTTPVQSPQSSQSTQPESTTQSNPSNLKAGLVIGRGISNFNTDDINKIRGLHSKQVSDALEYTPRRVCVIDSDNFAIHYHQ